MVDRKVYITAQVSMVLRVDEGADLDDILAEVSLLVGDEATVEDFGILDYKVTDSK
jgi:hypothetical protein